MKKPKSLVILKNKNKQILLENFVELLKSYKTKVGICILSLPKDYISIVYGLDDTAIFTNALVNNIKNTEIGPGIYFALRETIEYVQRHPEEFNFDINFRNEKS